ncbi:MAG: hypothetical protein ACFE94_06545 [Candidatus Hodarchaeota archaeon]
MKHRYPNVLVDARGGQMLSIYLSQFMFIIDMQRMSVTFTKLKKVATLFNKIDNDNNEI